MRSIDDPDLLTPDQRLAEVASILAAGVLRLHSRVAIADDAEQHSAPGNLGKSDSPGLAVPDETVLSVHNG
jgi:hypothetical protein